MISWIQKYFQHHFRSIFTVLLIVTIISFVWGINASGGLSGSGRQFAERHYFDYNLSLPEDQRRLFGDAQVSAQLQFGFAGFEPEQIQQFAFQRGAALHLANTWHIPAATDAEITEAIKNLRTFTGQDGQFDAKAYGTFRDNLKTSPRGGLTEADVKRVVSDDVRVDKVNKLLAGPGYVLPSDIKNQLARGETSWTLGVATADYTAFKTDVKPTDADLTKFFEENAFRYEIQPKLVASYVDFPTTQFLPMVTVTEAEVRAFYDQNPARFPKPAEVKPATPDAAITPPKPADPAMDFALVRTQVEAALKLERAQKLALKAASDLTLAIFEAKIANGAALETFLATRKLTLKPLPPFSRDAAPAELGGSAEIATEAFKLNEKNFVSEALSVPTGGAVLVWKDLQPARKPLFTEVRDKVSTDYIESEKRKRFVELGKTVKSQIEARLKAGDAFEKAVETAAATSNLKIEAKKIAPFTLRNRPQDLDFSVIGALEHLNQGQVSDMSINADKGILVYAVEKKLPDMSETSPAYADARKQLASVTSRMGASGYLAEMVQKELKKSEPKAP